MPCVNHWIQKHKDESLDVIVQRYPPSITLCFVEDGSFVQMMKQIEVEMGLKRKGSITYRYFYSKVWTIFVIIF